MFEWLINLPVWVQTPVVVVMVLASCVVLASIFHVLLWRVIRPTDDEREVAGYGVDGSVLKKLLLMTDRDEVTCKEKTAEESVTAVEDQSKRRNH